jgi:hypothetical protein
MQDQRIPKNTIRNNSIVQDRLQGLTYQELADKYNLSKGGIQKVMSKPDIKTMIEGGTAVMISRIPKAIKVQDKCMDSKNKAGFPTALAQKASELILKTGSIVPSNVTNQTINQVFNIQNNVTLSPGVAQAMGITLSNEDEDIINVTPEEKE